MILCGTTIKPIFLAARLPAAIAATGLQDEGIFVPWSCKAQKDRQHTSEEALEHLMSAIRPVMFLSKRPKLIFAIVDGKTHILACLTAIQSSRCRERGSTA